jgi:hypothetical protein
MGNIEVEFVRRHIGALRHEAHVAERAGIHDWFEVLAFDRVQFAGWGGVNEIEKAGKGIAKVKTAAAAVANIEYPPHLGIEFFLVIKILSLPVDRMPVWSCKATFAHLVFASLLNDTILPNDTMAQRTPGHYQGEIQFQPAVKVNHA